MKYAHLLNACKTPSEYADLAMIFANAGLGLATAMARNPPADPTVREHNANEALHYLDAVRVLEELVKP